MTFPEQACPHALQLELFSAGLTYSDGTKGPQGSYKLLFVALNPSKPIKTTHSYASSVAGV